MFSGNQFIWRADLLPEEKLVLLFLCETADFYGRCEFSEELLASVCNIPLKQLKGIIGMLIYKNLLILSPTSRNERKHEVWRRAIIIGGPNNAMV